MSEPDGPSVEQWNDVELSIVMPCLNEAETLEACVLKAQAFLQRSSVRGEIVVGDNGSVDASKEIAHRLGARVVDVPLRGYGAALYFATQAAQGRYVIMGDADDSYDFSDLSPFLERLRNGDELVMGNRFTGGIKPGAMPWKNRYIGNPVLSSIGRLFFGSPARDFHCGLRGFSKAAFQRMDLRTTGMEYASEMVIKATLMEMRISEVPTTLSPDGRSRPPHLRPWRDGWRHLRFMLLFSPRWLFLYPGIALMLLGVGVGVWLIPGPRMILNAGFDVDTLLYAGMGVLLGFQSVMFAVFTKVFAIQEGLMPRDARLDRMFQVIGLETGLVVGVGLSFAGLLGTAHATMEWAKDSFGPQNPQEMLRVVIPAAVAGTLGCQIILASLFLSVLGMKVRKLTSESNGTRGG